MKMKLAKNSPYRQRVPLLLLAPTKLLNWREIFPWIQSPVSQLQFWQFESTTRCDSYHSWHAGNVNRFLKLLNRWRFKLVIHGMKIIWFSRDWSNFVLCMCRRIVPDIGRFWYNQPVGFFPHSITAANYWAESCGKYCLLPIIIHIRWSILDVLSQHVSPTLAFMDHQFSCNSWLKIIGHI